MYEIVQRMQPDARILPVASTGGAALEVAHWLPNFQSDLEIDLDYLALFHRYIEVSVNDGLPNSGDSLAHTGRTLKAGGRE